MPGVPDGAVATMNGGYLLVWDGTPCRACMDRSGWMDNNGCIGGKMYHPGSFYRVCRGEMNNTDRGVTGAMYSQLTSWQVGSVKQRQDPSKN